MNPNLLSAFRSAGEGSRQAAHSKTRKSGSIDDTTGNPMAPKLLCLLVLVAACAIAPAAQTFDSLGFSDVGQ